MTRVLVPRGRLGLNVFSESVGYRLFEQTAALFIGEKAPAILGEPFALADAHELSRLVGAAHFQNVQVRSETYQARFTSVNDFIDYLLRGRLAHAVDALTDELRTILVATLRAAFEPYVGVDGLAFPMEAHVVRADT